MKKTTAALAAFIALILALPCAAGAAEAAPAAQATRELLPPGTVPAQVWFAAGGVGLLLIVAGALRYALKKAAAKKSPVADETDNGGQR